MKTFKWQICAAVPYRAFLVALNFCQPLLLHRSLSFTVEPVTSTTNNVGYGLVGAYVLVYIGLGVSVRALLHLDDTDRMALGYNGTTAASDLPRNNNGQRGHRINGLQKGVYIKSQRR